MLAILVPSYLIDPFYETGLYQSVLCQFVSLSSNYKLEIRWEFPGAIGIRQIS